jgi:hypothetical protein
LSKIWIKLRHVWARFGSSSDMFEQDLDQAPTCLLDLSQHVRYISHQIVFIPWCILSSRASSFFTVPSVELCDTRNIQRFQPLMWDFVHILFNILAGSWARFGSSSTCQTHLLDLEQDCWIFLNMSDTFPTCLLDLSQHYCWILSKIVGSYTCATRVVTHETHTRHTMANISDTQWSTASMSHIFFSKYQSSQSCLD